LFFENVLNKAEEKYFEIDLLGRDTSVRIDSCPVFSEAQRKRCYVTDIRGQGPLPNHEPLWDRIMKLWDIEGEPDEGFFKIHSKEWLNEHGLSCLATRLLHPAAMTDINKILDEGGDTRKENPKKLCNRLSPTLALTLGVSPEEEIWKRQVGRKTTGTSACSAFKAIREYVLMVDPVGRSVQNIDTEVCCKLMGLPSGRTDHVRMFGNVNSQRLACGSSFEVRAALPSFYHQL